jgi:hypothetical protein
MCDSPTSRSASDALHADSESERRTDRMYMLLTHTGFPDRDKLAHGIAALVQEQTKHPAVTDMIEHLDGNHDSILLQRALIAAALVYEPSMLQYLLDAPDTCSSTLSQYAVEILPPLLEELLNGNTSLKTFVLDITHAYTLL